MGNCALICHKKPLNEQNSVIHVDVCSPSNFNSKKLTNSPTCKPIPTDQNPTQSNSPLPHSEETLDPNSLRKKFSTPFPTAMAIAQKAKGLKKRNSRFSATSNISSITIYIFGPIKSGKTSLMHTFWNGIQHPFNPNDPYIHTESEEIVEKKFQTNSKQYDIVLKVPINKDIKKNESFTEYFLILFALNENEQFHEAKNIYETYLNEYHYRKKDVENVLSYSNVIMMGTKGDLERKVKEEDIDKYIKENGLMYVEVSMMNSKMLNSFLQMLVNYSEQNNFMFNGKS